VCIIDQQSAQHHKEDGKRATEGVNDAAAAVARFKAARIFNPLHVMVNKISVDEMQQLFQPASSASSASSSAQAFSKASSVYEARAVGQTAAAGSSPVSYVRELGAQAAERRLRLPASARESVSGASSGGGGFRVQVSAPLRRLRRSKKSA